jgi:hypothetical protein
MKQGGSAVKEGIFGKIIYGQNDGEEILTSDI